MMENELLSSSLRIGTISPSLENVGTYEADLLLTEERSGGNNPFDLKSSDGPQVDFYELPRDPLYVVIPITIIYVMIFITGTIGNISTCIVIARNKSMHTATNYYLFSLAISDLLLLLSGMPAEIYMVWYKYPYIFGEVFCILRGLAAETSTNASVLTIAAFTVERYVAICHPFLSQTMSKLSRAVKLILAIWIVALSFALPQALQFGVIPFSKTNPEMVMCLVKRILVRHSFELSTFLFFVVPMCLITVLYVLIGLKLKKSNMMKKTIGRTDTGSSCRHPGRSSRRILKMLVAVVFAFFICWAPFHVQRLIAIYGASVNNGRSVNKKWMEYLNPMMTYISGVFYYVSTTINPILYNIMSNKFRAAFMETLSRSCVPGLPARTVQRSYSSLSRSQQRTAGGAYGSRIGTGGTALPPDSSDCSGNSLRDESLREKNCAIKGSTGNPPSNVSENNSKRTASPGTTTVVVEAIWKNGNLLLRDNNSSADEGRNNEEEKTKRIEGRRPNKRNIWIRPIGYSAVTILKNDRPRRKWWRLLSWLPSLKSLKFFQGETYTTPPEEPISDDREEFSMTVRNNLRECAEQRPV